MRVQQLSILLFMCLVAGRCTAFDSSEEEQYRKTGSVASPRPVILNPFNVFGNPKCFYNGDEGRCYGEVECLALAGNYGAFCPGLQGLCCLFYRTCNQRTSQETSYFRNLQWPLEDQAPNACTFKVIRRSDKYCGLKVDAEKVDLPPKAGSCTNTYVHVTGAGNHSPMPLCGRSTGINYAIDFRHVSEVSIHVNSTTRSSAAWNIKLTQVPCAEFTGETGGDSSASGGGIGSAPVGGSTGGVAVFPPPMTPSTAPTPTIARPTTAPTTTDRPTTVRDDGKGSHTALPTEQEDPLNRRRPPTTHDPVPTTYSTCGVKGRSSRKRRDADIDDDFEASDELFSNWNSVGRSSVLRRNHQPDMIQPGNPFLKDLEYDGPYVNDSNFSYYAGPPSILASRITYGINSDIREYPWQVAMFIGGRYHCGASVIGDWFILTAAHCVVSYQVNPSVLRLSLGDWDVSNNQDGSYMEARVDKVRVHPSYSRSTLQNDLAVLKLTQRIEFSERVRPVCLPSSDIATDGKRATVTGWGRDENKRLKSKLQELAAEITTNSHCGERWMAKKAPAGFIASTMMCMDASNGDSCNGDSGGPSVMEIPQGSGKFVQIGIVSFGSGSCTDANLPGVYTRVSKFRDWIRQQMF